MTRSDYNSNQATQLSCPSHFDTLKSFFGHGGQDGKEYTKTYVCGEKISNARYTNVFSMTRSDYNSNQGTQLSCPSNFETLKSFFAHGGQDGNQYTKTYVCGEVVIKCTRPRTTTGYAIASEILSVPNFAVKFTNNACAAGYSGIPTAIKCTSAGSYTLKGCTGTSRGLFLQSSPQLRAHVHNDRL